MSEQKSKSKVKQVKPRQKSPRDEIRNGNSLILSEVDSLKRKEFELVVTNYAAEHKLIAVICTNRFTKQWTLSYHNTLLVFRDVDTEDQLTDIVRTFSRYGQQFLITTGLSIEVCNRVYQLTGSIQSIMLILDATKSRVEESYSPATASITAFDEVENGTTNDSNNSNNSKFVKFVNRGSLILSGPVGTGKSQRTLGLEKLAKDDGLRVTEVFDIADDRHQKVVRFSKLTKTRYDLVICHELYDLETFDVLVRHLATEGLQFIVATTLPDSKVDPILRELLEFGKPYDASESGSNVIEVIFCHRGCLPITYYELDNRDWVNEWAAKPSSSISLLEPIVSACKLANTINPPSSSSALSGSKSLSASAEIKVDDKKIYGLDKYPPSLLLLGPGGVSGKFVREAALEQVAWVRRISCCFMHFASSSENDSNNHSSNSSSSSAKFVKLASDLDSSSEFTGVGNSDFLRVQDLQEFLTIFGGRGKHLLMGTSLSMESISSSIELKEQLVKNNVKMINAAIPIDCFPGALAWASKL